MIPDDRLRLIFTCCHPALDPKSRVALTLRSIAGLTTAEIARAFLDAEPTMGQRLSRAKAKIAAARIPYAIPGPEDWDERLKSVLAVIYLIYNAGYTPDPGSARDLCAEAIFLTRLLDHLRPGEPEIEGALALLLLTQSRARARIGADGASVPLHRQDRALWDGAARAEGLGLIDRAMARRAPGPYQIKAAIAACHGRDDGADWPQIAALYTRLLDYEPTPVVRLNRAVARAEAGDLPAALAEVEALADMLEDYQPFHAARADLLRRTGQNEAARAAYERAIALAGSLADAAFLTIQRDKVLN
jgi:predicted RNA polymerase sigma factor